MVASSFCHLFLCAVFSSGVDIKAGGTFSGIEQSTVQYLKQQNDKDTKKSRKIIMAAGLFKEGEAARKTMKKPAKKHFDYFVRSTNRRVGHHLSASIPQGGGGGGGIDPCSPR